MKKIPLLIAFLFAALLCSCEKDETIPEGKVRIDVRASFYDVFKDLKDTSGKLCFTGPLPDSLRFRVGFFLFRDKGDGSCREECHTAVFLNNIKDLARVSMDVESGMFKMITVVDIVVLKDGKVVDFFNEIGIHEDPAQMEINCNKSAGCYNAIGYLTTEKIHLQKSGEKVSVDLEMKPLGSLLTFCFYNVDSGSPAVFYSVPSVYRCLLTLQEKDRFDIYNKFDYYRGSILLAKDD